MKTIEELARDVIAMLDAQQDYFKARAKTPQKDALLKRSKAKEDELRKTCCEILHPTPLIPSLFGEEEDTDPNDPPQWWTGLK